MRIKILLMTIVAISLVSCEYEYRADIEDCTEKGTLPFPRITHFKYKEHHYIFFDQASAQFSVGGVVHDPDCECLK